ncbi:MAG: NAD(P)H-dependent oxidoreductase [Treponema sp.]|nr:NAD(P)H-dependent oxidoreductase [Treponema sp.]
MTLYINACVRKNSRTDELARYLLTQSAASDLQEVHLQAEQILPLDEKMLSHRDECIARGDFTDPIFSYARQFALADEIVISAPYWDLLFPASLRAYIERVCVVGVTFAYTEEGAPKSLCRAKRLTYVTTAGGFIGGRHLGFDYVQAVAAQFFGISDIRLVKAEGLDIKGADVQAILAQAKRTCQQA